MTPRADRDKAEFRRRIGVYALGVAIGLLLLGMIYTQRRQMAANRPPAAPPAPPAPAVPAAPDPAPPSA